MDKAEAESRCKELKALCGAIIKNPIMDEVTDPDNVWWGFRAVKKDGTTFHVWVKGDDEGNYPGALDIEKIPRNRQQYKDAEQEVTP